MSIGKKWVSRILAAVMILGSAPFIPGVGTVSEAAAAPNYTVSALPIEGLPGVYKAVAAEGADLSTATLGIPSIAKQTLADKPTTESPAIITGAAVNYETKTGPTEFTPIPGKELVAPYSYFRWGVIEEQTQGEAGTTGTHKKLSGFDGSYYIIRVDLSQLLAGVENPDGKYLHVRQQDNKALMVASGIQGTTFSDALGNKTGSYSLADNFAALKDTVGADQDTPYLDVILMSSAKLVAGADQGKETAPSSDVKLSFYVDDTADYNPDLKYDPTSQDTNHVANVMKKFFDDEKAAAGEAKTSYLVKGSDLEIDCMVDDTEVEGDKAEYWSLSNAIAYQPYDSHTVRLICEAPILEGLHIESTTGAKRSVVLDVNSFDIQIANNTKTGAAGLVVSKNAELMIKDGTKTAGAELAIGNNAIMVIENGGTLVVDESCVNEVEYDAATITGEQTQPADPLLNGQIIVKAGGKLINHGVVNIEGLEAKPMQQNAQEQAAAEQVTTDMKSASMLVEEGAELINDGCLAIKGTLYMLGILTNSGRYTDVINANDPDKGVVPYHKGIQLSWKDVVTTEGVEPGTLNVGLDADGKKYPNAMLMNYGDIVITPGYLNVYGFLVNTGNIYLADVTEAVVPITPTAEAPTVVEERVKLDPPRLGLITVDPGASVDPMDPNVLGAKVEIKSNGRLGDLTVTGEAVLPLANLKATDNILSVNDGTIELIKDKFYKVTDGAVEFTDLYKAFFSGTRTVKVNVGYRYLTFTVVGTKKESSGGGIVQPEEEEKEEQKEEEQKEEEKEGDGKKESENPPEENPIEVTGTWHKNLKGWWYGFSDGTYAEDGWYKIDSDWYYFNGEGYMEADAFRNGYYLTESGAWDGNKAIGWKKNAKGWWYAITEDTWLADTWKLIDGKWYFFHETGFAAQNEFVKGWWCDKNCVQSYIYRCTWRKDENGWWYGDPSGWYAKGKSYVIDGTSYDYDREGYCLNP